MTRTSRTFAGYINREVPARSAAVYVHQLQTNAMMVGSKSVMVTPPAIRQFKLFNSYAKIFTDIYGYAPLITSTTIGALSLFFIDNPWVPKKSF